ncbi:MAG: hypothetical protein JWO53_148, partial [Chlamydiia bacterium]|nr:hypothetical protein [Chlamydiia bacterium]
MFWQRHPALLFGFIVTLGCMLALSPSWTLLIPFTFLLFHTKFSSQFFVACVVGCLYYLLSLYCMHLPSPQEELISGSALVEIEDLSQGIRYNTPFWKLRLKVHSLENVKNVSCTATWKDFSQKPDPHFLYEVQGSLKRVGDSAFIFTAARGAKWEKRDKGWQKYFSLVDLRLSAKLALKTYLRGHLPPTDTRTFLEGLLLGEFNDPLLADQLRSAGLSHIMVVSGFHFSLIAAFFGILLRFFVSWHRAIILLFLSTTLYFLFIGMNPSVMRAWISIALLLIGKIFQRQSTGLNSLGVGIMAVLLYNPSFCLHIGFQLSFLAAGAILLFYPICIKILVKYFPKRSVSSALELTPLNQVGHVCFVFFRNSWALLLAVHLLMLPMALYRFQTFPLMGIFYNLFFPFLVGIALF